MQDEAGASSDPNVAAPPESPKQPTGALIAIVTVRYLLWAGFGFLTAFHIMSLLCSSEKRGAACCHLCIHFTALIVFGIGGGACRSMGSDACPGGETMSQSCLIYHQDAAYQFFYITHYIGLAWVVIQWFTDGLSIWGWSKDRLFAFGVSVSDSAPEDMQRVEMKYHYAAVASCTGIVTLIVWTVHWSTDPSDADLALNQLGLILFVVVVVWIVGCCIAVRCRVHHGNQGQVTALNLTVESDHEGLPT